MRFSFLLLSLVLATALVGCRKDQLFTGATTLEFTKGGKQLDTLTFDTVFTTLGSAVRSFVVHNRENRRVNISSLRIEGGEASPFRLNVDGVPGKVFTNVDINAKDSIYVFVAVTIDPDNATNPFVVQDRVLFDVNGATQSMVLNAWGQNAYFHYGQTLDVTQTWPNDKPHVVINSILVGENTTLTIQAGTRVYMHANSGFFVEGTLIVNGTKQDSVVFQGDRLEPYFRDLPGSWGFIYFTPNSKNNELTHTVVKDALYGIYVDSVATNNHPKVKLFKCTIRNMYKSGIRVYQGSIYAENTLVYNCGDYCVEMFNGGFYDFVHCTFANYGSITLSHQKPSIVLTNYYVAGNVIYPALHYGTDANFTNCIIWGSLDKELAIDSTQAAGPLKFRFDHCIIKSDDNLESDEAHFPGVKRNQNPLFVNATPAAGTVHDYRLGEGSPAIDAGTTSVMIADDLDDKPRLAPPDIGCYEK